MSSRVEASQRLTLLVVAVLLVFGAILFRLCHLHIWGQADLLGAVERSRQKFEVMHACRGNIVDIRGNLLAGTRSVVDVGVDPQAVRAIDKEKWGQLANILGLSKVEVEEAFTTKVRKGKGFGAKDFQLIRWKKLAGSVPEKKYNRLMNLGIKGVYGNRRYERYYPQEKMGAHIIGFINKEDKSVSGVERFMDFYMKGQDGWLETERDGRRRELGQFRTREIVPTNGAHVELSLDSLVQHSIEQEMDRLVEQYNPRGATIIVSDPSTGYILGLANYPSYNPNRFWEYDMDCHRNRAVADVYEPGSPFKVVAASAVLNEGVLELDKVYDCSKDRAEYRGRIVKLPRDHKEYGELTAREVIMKSSNRGVARMAMDLGEEKLLDYIKNFGFGEKVGWGIDAEVQGTVHEIKHWDGLTIGRLPMGHAVNCTAMQMNYAMSVIANRGVLMKPQVVKRIFDDDGETVEYFAPKARRRVLKESVAKEMTELLTDVVGPDGTSGRASIDGFQVAGKSGTTQKILGGKYSRKHHVGSFSGFFPSDNPRVVMTIVIDDAKREGVAYGGIVAAPSFRHIGEKLAQYLNIQPDFAHKRMVASKGQ